MWQSVPLLSLTLSLGAGPAPMDGGMRAARGDAAQAEPAPVTELQVDDAGSAPRAVPAEGPSTEPSPSAPPPSESPLPSAEAPTEPPAAAEEPPGSGAEPPETTVGTLPDADPAAPDAADGASDPTTEPRTWNDPEAAVAAAASPGATPPPPVDDLGNEPLEPGPKRDPTGFGMAMVGALTFSPQSGHAWAEGGCPVANLETSQGTVTYAPGCSASPSAGVSAEGRFGYMWPFIGVELYGQIATDYVNARLDGLPPISGVPEYATQMHIGRIGIGGGAQARFKTPPGPVRLSVGAGGGFLVRGLFSNVSSLDGSFETYVAPVLRADVGVVLANVFTIGLMGWLEFPPTVTITPDLSVLGEAGIPLENALDETVVVRGTQGVIGVFGGFAFGK